jgi:hypothetical protein
VLVDIAELEVREPLALASLAGVAQAARRWPATPIVLCAPRPETARHLAGSPVRRSLSLARSRAEAMARARQSHRPTLLMRLPPTPDSCRHARALVAQACADWQATSLTPTATVIATELVANVVRHARTTMEFTVAVPGRLSLAVRDHSDRMPRVAEAGPHDAGGRGLRLVRGLADAWGVLPLARGKVVWATLALPGAAA